MPATGRSLHADSEKVELPEAIGARMHRLKRRGLRETTRPGGYKINSSWAEMKTKGAIPSNFIQSDLFEADRQPPENLLIMGNNAANDPYTLRCKAKGLKIHPARYPRALPEFFIKMLTDE